MTPEMNFPNDIEGAAEVGTNKNKSARKDVGQQSLTHKWMRLMTLDHHNWDDRSWLYNFQVK